MFRLSLHIGPLHVEVGVGSELTPTTFIADPSPHEEEEVIIDLTTCPFDLSECLHPGEEYEEEYHEGEWDE